MARVSENNGHGWDFVKEGEIYQYKEDGFVCWVKILKDKSDDKMYRFRVQALAGNLPVERIKWLVQSDETIQWDVGGAKGMTGVYSGMVQFYTLNDGNGYFMHDPIVYKGGETFVNPAEAWKKK